MDTRDKIRSLDEFVARDASQRWTAVLGVFDPFTVEVARYIASLASAGRKLLVIVNGTLDDAAEGQGSATFLSAQARARMLASLRVVDAVVIASAPAAKEFLRGAGIDVRFIEDPGSDRRRSEQFVQYVLDRQASAVAQKN